MKIYFAAPLFSAAELKFNQELVNKIEQLGLKVHLPQRDGPLFTELIKVIDRDSLNKKIFDADFSAIKECDALLMLLDGRVPDEGACVELGIAVALGKRCFGLKTDSRSFRDGADNPMLLGSLEKLFRSENELLSFLKTITSQ